MMAKAVKAPLAEPVRLLSGCLCCSHEQVEDAKREMRKEKALKKAYKVDKEGDDGASSDEYEDPDEDKLAEEEEAGKISTCGIAPACLAAVQAVC